MYEYHNSTSEDAEVDQMLCFGLIQKGNNATLMYNDMILTNKSDDFTSYEKWKHIR